MRKYAEKIHPKFKYEIECPQCGTSFIPVEEERGKRKLCKACQPIFVEEPQGIVCIPEKPSQSKKRFADKNCLRCTILFSPRSPNQKYCDKCAEIRKKKR